MVPIGGTVFAQGLTRFGKGASGYRAGKDEALGFEEAAVFQNIAQSLHIGAIILRMVLPGKIVMGGQVQDNIRSTFGIYFLEHTFQCLGVSDIHLEPRDVFMDRGAAPYLGTASQGKDPVIVLEGIQQMAADEPGGSSNDNPR